MHRNASVICLELLLVGFFGVAAPAQAQHVQVFPFNFTDGSSPQGGLVADAAGNLYGTTTYGGNGPCRNNQSMTVGCGVVFEMTPPASGTKWTETVLLNFVGNGAGAWPVGNLIFDSFGNLYGVTTLGGIYAQGSVCELSQQGGSWIETTLYSFGLEGGHAQRGPGV